ncbi:MAG: hypothetical protein MUD12_10340 [Spirochaetes bacterium]|nr:hypothetical protein [Spirochaetota bacterium]
MKRATFFILIIVLLLSSCERHDLNKFNTLGLLAASVPAVYVAGDYTLGGNTAACAWINGARIDLTDPAVITIAQASGISISGYNYHVGGIYNNGVDFIPCIWTNGVKQELLYTNNTSILGVNSYGPFITGGGYWTDGAGDEIACYWLNGTRFDIVGGGGVSANVTSVKTCGNGIYMSLTYMGTLCYYHNGVLVSYPITNSYAEDIFVDGKDVYLSGYRISGPNQLPCYWKNGKLVDLPIPAGSGLITEAASIWVDTGNVYACGYYDLAGVSYACIWINGTRIDISDGINWAVAYAIKVKNGNVFVCGQRLYGGIGRAYVWMNGQIQYLDIPAGATGSVARALDVGYY